MNLSKISLKDLFKLEDLLILLTEFQLLLYKEMTRNDECLLNKVKTNLKRYQRDNQTSI